MTWTAVGQGDRISQARASSQGWLLAFYDLYLVVGFTARSKRGDMANGRELQYTGEGFFFLFPSFFLFLLTFSPFFGRPGADQQQNRISFNTLEGGGSGSVFFLLLRPRLPVGMAAAVNYECDCWKSRMRIESGGASCCALLCCWVVKSVRCFVPRRL